MKQNKLSDEINTANSINIKIDYDEYKKIRKLFPNKFIKKFVIALIIILIFDIMALIPDPDLEPITMLEIVTFDFVLIILSFIIIVFISLISRKISYMKLVKQNLDNIEYTVDIYADYLIKKGKNITQKIMFDDIKKYKETTTKLYLKIDLSTIIPIPELDMTAKEIDFIKYSIDTKNSKNKDYKYYLKKQRKIKKENSVMRIILIILFVITLLTPWLAMWCILLLSLKNSAFEFETFKYTYGALFVLPIPLLSLVLGIIYKIKGIKCLKNIIAGGIMTFMVLLISSFTLVQENYNEDYSNLDVYKDVIKIDLPSDGSYTKIKWDNGNISNSVKFENNKETEKFYQDIIKSDIWILKQDISTNLSIFMPNAACYSRDKNCYYSIYISELDSYNLVPEESGKYHIISMLYDPEIKRLLIEDFGYLYKS